VLVSGATARRLLALREDENARTAFDVWHRKRSLAHFFVGIDHLEARSEAARPARTAG
jgi:hypothetical protein